MEKVDPRLFQLIKAGFNLDVLLDSPVHGQVCDRKGWDHVEGLCPKSPPCVENSCVGGTSKWSLSVCGNGIGDYALLGLGPCGLKSISMFFNAILPLLSTRP